MTEAFNIHSILFEITDHLGYGKDAGLILAMLAFAACMALDYAYIFKKIDACLLINTAIGILAAVGISRAAVLVLNDLTGVSHITHFLAAGTIFHMILAFGFRRIKTDYFDPMMEKEMQEELEAIFKEEGIAPDSREAMELRTIYGEKSLRKLLQYDTSDILNLEAASSRIHQ